MLCRMRFQSTWGGAWAAGVIIGTWAKSKQVSGGERMASGELDGAMVAEKRRQLLQARTPQMKGGGRLPLGGWQEVWDDLEEGTYEAAHSWYISSHWSRGGRGSCRVGGEPSELDG
ncbi:hypothetical protein BC826DRAFT_973072 [Russula brevipes]|nr:hypothetical protein BC826DRAFT_973072 [Russula brevipes]